ncbi:hypothetical protein D3C81_1346150 [compost metagenome]
MRDGSAESNSRQHETLRLTVSLRRRRKVGKFTSTHSAKNLKLQMILARHLHQAGNTNLASSLCNNSNVFKKGTLSSRQILGMMNFRLTSRFSTSRVTTVAPVVIAFAINQGSAPARNSSIAPIFILGA